MSADPPCESPTSWGRSQNGGNASGGLAMQRILTERSSSRLVQSNYCGGPTDDDSGRFQDLLVGKFQRAVADEQDRNIQGSESALLDWIFGVEMPNPERAPSSRGVSRSDAEAIVMKSFRGKEFVNAAVAGSQAHQRANAVAERNAFMQVFDTLPESFDGRGKAWGESPPLEDHNSTYENTPKSFLSLIRNMIVGKLMLHCSVQTKCVLSEDAERIYIIATCRAHELLREADRESFPTPLDVVAVDPEALEPCTKTFYPLSLFWATQSQEPPPWLEDRVTKILKHLEDQIQGEESKAMYFTRMLSHWSSVPFRKDAMLEASPCMKRHIGRKSRKHLDETLEAFKRYLDLRCEQPLSCEYNDGLKIVNQEQEASGKAKLYNFYDRLRLPIIPPYLNFEIGLYLESRGKPWIWQHHYAKLLDSDMHLALPFNCQQIAKLFKTVMDRQIDFDELIDGSIVTSIFPLDKRDKLERFQRTSLGMCVHSTEALTDERSELFLGWSFPQGSRFQQIRSLAHSLFRPPSADAIRSYYGEDIAFYFAFSIHLCRWSVVLAVFGALTFIGQNASQGCPLAHAVIDVSYSLFVACWATAWNESWKREESTLIALWGQQPRSSINEVTRPSFRGLPQRSPINFRRDDDLCEPVLFAAGQFGWLPRRVLTALVMVVFTIIVLGLMIGVISARSQLERVIPPALARAIATVMLSALMFLLSSANYPFCKALNQFENHRLSRDYNWQLILKQSVMEMTCNFLIYFYLAFGKGAAEGCVEGQPGRQLQDLVCWDDLKLSYFSIFISLVAMNLVELGILDAVIPSLKASLTKTFKGGNVDGKNDVKSGGKATIAHILDGVAGKAPFDLSAEVSGTYYEYIEIVVYFGHMVLFSVVFPLAPLICMALLLVEVRVDGHKLFHRHRRPMPRDACGIGPWTGVFQVISWFSVLTNALLLTYTLDPLISDVMGDNLQRNFSRLLTLGCIVAALVLFKLVLVYVIPDVPHNLKLLQDHNMYVQQSVTIEDLSLLSLDVEYLDTRVHDIGDLVPTHDERDYGFIRDIAIPEERKPLPSLSEHSDARGKEGSDSDEHSI